MGEDFLNQSKCLQMSEEQQRACVTNEVLIFLQEELEGMGTCLEKFGLPTPDIENRIQRIPKVIAEEMFDINTQQEISSIKCAKLNMDQQDAFCTIMKAIHDENHPQHLFFLNAPGEYGKHS